MTFNKIPTKVPVAKYDHKNSSSTIKIVLKIALAMTTTAAT